MALILKRIYDVYDYYFIQYEDDRVSGLFLVGSFWPITAIIFGYLYFVTGKGQELMRNRKPFELKNIIIVYNLFQIFVNLYIALGATIYLAWNNGPVLCVKPPWNDYSTYEMTVLHFCHVYYLTKVIDLLDTVFFVLRKKNNQVSFLHIYHHTAMAYGVYFYLRFMSGGGQPIMLGIINSYVHTIMYGYYFMTSFRPELKQSMWWKRYITQVQLIQFAVLFVHFLTPIFVECGFPKMFSLALALQNVFMLLLFGDFYYKAYIKKKPAVKKEE